jgi:carboxypeptidase family protein
MLLSGSAYAQATLAGVVKDSSGAVLPGVTVEASSPVLIEKVRTAISNGTGQYRIESLPPGTYTVSFTLSYNLFNANPGTAFNQMFSAGSTTYLRPTTILRPRFVRFNATVDF